MRIRMLPAFAMSCVCFVFGANNAAADYPDHEVWLGFGGAASLENDIFNVPDDIGSSPDVAITLGYMKNLNERQALGFHVYGTSETTPELTLQSASGTQLATFDLNTYNFGVRYRQTLSFGTWKPYVFGGLSWANGSIDSKPTGELTYNGISACAGPGVRVALGRHLLAALEGIATLGVASWKSEPFNNSSGKEFNPSILGGTVSLSYVWGWTP